MYIYVHALIRTYVRCLHRAYCCHTRVCMCACVYEFVTYACGIFMAYIYMRHAIRCDGIMVSGETSSVEITHCFSDTFVCGLSTVCDVQRNVCGASIVVAALLLKQPCSNGPNVDTHVYECDPCKNALVSTFHTCVVHTCPCTTGAHVCLGGSAISGCSLSLSLPPIPSPSSTTPSLLRC